MMSDDRPHNFDDNGQSGVLLESAHPGLSPRDSDPIDLDRTELSAPQTSDSNVLPTVAPRGQAMKFAYTSGSRPLDGYTIKRGIGVGGFGEVYFATSDAGKEIALKRVQRNLDVEVRGVTQCLNLKHANLIDLYDIKYDDQGQAWVVMEYVGGECLKETIDRHPDGLPREDVRAWFTGIAAGVAYLHDHGIVHRDLKPGNIFSDEGCVKIGDYGLSKFISCSRRSGQTESVGTFHYMAPEIGRGSYGREIDIYALGIILYEMLTGRVPFEGESSQEIIMKHLTADPDVSGLPQPFAAVISRGLVKDPEKRFRDVNEMVTALGWNYGPAWPLGIGSTQVAEIAEEEASNNGKLTHPARQDVFEIRDEPPQKPEPLYIGDDLPSPLPVTPGIEFGQVKEQPPVIGGIKARHRQQPQYPPTQRPGPQGRMPTAAVRAPVPQHEPIAMAVGSGWKNMAAWWNDSSLGTPLKVIVLVVVGIALVFNASWLVPLAMIAGALYLVYYGIWVGVQAWHERDANTAHDDSSYSPGLRRRRWQDAARELLRNRAPGEKIAELTGSLLMAAFVAAVFSVVMLVIGAKLDGSVESLAFFCWFAVSSTLGAWSVLIAGKAMEGRTGEEVRRRFVMLIVGLMLGVMAFGVSQLLMVRVSNVMDFPHATDTRYTAGVYASGLPLLPAYLAYFAGLFVALRWWKQADPLRATRFSLWATGVCVLWAALLEMFWHFPQPWGLMLVATISIAAQLSAPWFNPQQRAELRSRLGSLPARG